MPRRPEQMGIQEYQDYTFAINDEPGRRLTDDQLLEDWARRFPGRDAKVFAGTVEERRAQIRGIRGHYNRRQKNEHGQRNEFGDVIGPPERISLPYDEAGRQYLYSERWLESSLNGRSPAAAGVPSSVLVGAPRLRPEAAVLKGALQRPRLDARRYLEELVSVRSGRPASDTSQWPRADAVEFSTALDSVGLPHLVQYPPSGQASPTAQNELESLLASTPGLIPELAAESLPEISPPVPPVRLPAVDFFVDPPAMAGPSPSSGGVVRAVTDWIHQGAVNARLGEAGEQWMLELERRRLIEEGRPDLAERVQWVSKIQGDGAGYDIHSFSRDGRDRCLEVKTTSNNSKRAPFYVTANEVRRSVVLGMNFVLCRVFAFGTNTRVYELRGPLTETCSLVPATYIARAGAALSDAVAVSE